MWICPKCRREFKRTNQGHYCGKAPENVDEYIESQIPEARAHIVELRNIIQSCVPEVMEQIAWSMPVYKKDKISISFAACNKHISFYIEANILEIFKPQLSEFTIKKNAIYLPYEKELPLKVIEKIVKQSFETK
ncbi:MAG: DUF1801 domain-containing protein [Lachnospiraceae bacterium]|nr:DUF1801 domain-containing protein [Lachnospiraceae bacterium]